MPQLSMPAFANVSLLAMDVDGVLTDGTLGYDIAGGEQKRFHVADGMGVTLLHLAGVHVAWLSGRDSPVVAKRAAELKVNFLFQGVKQKEKTLVRLMEHLSIVPAGTAYIGDDWNDLPAFEVAGLGIAVANADAMVRAKAHYVTNQRGGEGAVREVCNLILEAKHIRIETLDRYLTTLKETAPDGPVGQ